MRKNLWIAIMAACLQCTTGVLFSANIEPTDDGDPITEVPSYTNEELKLRVANLDIPFESRYTPYVRERIEEYVKTYRKRTSRILGLSAIYFPVIEQYLAANNVPDALKYLTIIETCLNPKALSPDGAAGIWQFMPTTGAIYGLTSNSIIDERSDIHKSTEAAAKYLRKLYDIYGDWALVLAAYNAGPGRVNGAIKQGHSTNFWKISKYLPEQTRKYVPGFIAAAYAMQYFPYHAIVAENPDLDLQLTREMKVFKELSFDEVSMVTGLSLETIATLNPQYPKNYIPSTPDGEFLTLPKRLIGSFNDYVNLPDGRKADYLKLTPMVQDPDAINTIYYYRTTYVSEAADNLKSIADLFSISTHSLKVWNNITDATLKPGTELILFLPKKVETKLVEVPALKRMRSSKISTMKMASVFKTTVILPDSPIRSYSSAAYVFYVLRPDESLQQVAERFGISLNELMLRNQLDEDNPPLPGMLLRIKEIDTAKP